MPSTPRHVVVLGTGGTISARAESPGDNVAYQAGAVSAAALAAALQPLPGVTLESEQVADLDSKDMDFATWRTLAGRVAAHLARPEVAGLVITHGTDTLEETAWFLQRVLAPPKPVVLTAAMRPASSRLADGPQNLADAVSVALTLGARGVVAVLAGGVHSARDVRKTHPYRLAAFGSGDAGPLGWVEEGRLRSLRSWPEAAPALGLERLPDDPAAWPFVAVIGSGAGVDGREVSVLVAAGCAGIVVAATGNGTLARALESALLAASQAGVALLRSTRCLDGTIIEIDAAKASVPSAGDLTPHKARVELILRLLAAA